MKPKLCKAGQQLRNQLDDDYPERDRKSDGWVADARHMAKGTSDHIPDKNGVVRAIDIDADLAAHPEEAHAIVERLRLLAKAGDKRIKYIIFDGKIMSPILNWKRRAYKGANPHRHHFHVSFTKLGDNDGRWFDLLGEKNDERSQTDGRKLGEDIPRSSLSDLSLGGLRCQNGSQCCYCCRIAEHNQLSKPSL